MFDEKFGASSARRYFSLVFEKIMQDCELIDAIGFEGVVYSGKTSASRNLVNKNALCALLPDTMEIVSGLPDVVSDVPRFVDTQSKLLDHKDY